MSSFLVVYSTCGRLYFQMFEDLLVVLENLEELDHRKRGELLYLIPGQAFKDSH